MTRLRSLVERTGIALFLVSHLKRSLGDRNHEEGARVTLGQLRGSASIAQLSDAVIGLERDQQSDKNGGDTTVRVLKNRYSGETGVACTLAYNLETCKFDETEPDKEFDPATDFETPHQQAMLTRPKPPTEEAIKKAQFIDKTYVWKAN